MIRLLVILCALCLVACVALVPAHYVSVDRAPTPTPQVSSDDPVFLEPEDLLEAEDSEIAVRAAMTVILLGGAGVTLLVRKLKQE